MADTHAVATEHSPQLRHHFDDMGQQFDSATFGMWVFLLTEIMFFGGMFWRLHHLSQHVPGSFRRAPATSWTRRSARLTPRS